MTICRCRYTHLYSVLYTTYYYIIHPPLRFLISILIPSLRVLCANNALWHYIRHVYSVIIASPSTQFSRFEVQMFPPTVVGASPLVIILFRRFPVERLTGKPTVTSSKQRCQRPFNVQSNKRVRGRSQ